jgi:hypothetical protein
MFIHDLQQQLVGDLPLQPHCLGSPGRDDGHRVGPSPRFKCNTVFTGIA